MCHKECLLVNHKKYLFDRIFFPRVKGAVDERYVTLWAVCRPALRNVTRGWGGWGCQVFRKKALRNT